MSQCLERKQAEGWRGAGRENPLDFRYWSVVVVVVLVYPTVSRTAPLCMRVRAVGGAASSRLVRWNHGKGVGVLGPRPTPPEDTFSLCFFCYTHIYTPMIQPAI